MENLKIEKQLKPRKPPQTFNLLTQAVSACTRASCMTSSKYLEQDKWERRGQPPRLPAGAVPVIPKAVPTWLLSAGSRGASAQVLAESRPGTGC